jgi:methionyl-tRNA formyltransferase
VGPGPEASACADRSPPVTIAPLPAEPPRRLAFLGTPALAVPPLQALVDAGFGVAVVVSQPDRRRGRGGALQPSPVKAAALELGLAVTDRVADVVDAGVDLGVVVAYGRLIPVAVLERVPMVNLHFSLLPRWRGAAPVERAILAGDDRTGVDLMVVEEGLDTGGVLARCEVPIGPDDDLEALRTRLVEAGTALLVDHLPRGLGEPAPQEGDPTYAAKLDHGERELDWGGPAIDVHRRVRVGGAWTTHQGRRLKVHRTLVPPSGDGPVVPAGDGPVELVEVQPEGKPRMPAADWARGARWQPGERLPS